MIEPYVNEMKNAGMIKGMGLLKYISIFSGQDGKVQIRENLIFDLNKELGFWIQGGE